MVTAWLLPLVAFLAVASTGWATAIVGRRLSAPTARFLFAVVLVLFVTALAQFLVVGPAPVRGAVTALTGVQSPESYWQHLAFGCVLLAAGFWFLFAVQYTGRGERLTRQVAAAVVALWIVFYANALWVSLGTVAGATVTLVGTLGGGLFFMAALATIGVLLVWETTPGRNAVPSSEGALLSAGALCAVYSPAIAANLDQPIVLSVLLTAASLAVVVAVVRYPVFSTLPVARIAARDSLVEELEDAVLIVDRLGRIRDLNPAAATVFGLDEEAAHGRSLQDLLTATIDPDGIADAAEPYRLRTGRETLSVTGQRVTDDRGRWVGHLLVCRDVTERERRERRLQVLTRLLAGTIREPATSIARRADAIAADSGSEPHGNGAGADRAPAVPREESSSVGREIQEIAAVLKDLVARTRDVERAIAGQETGPTDVASIVASLAGEQDDRPIEVESPLPEAATAPVDGELLEAVLDLLFEEAAARCESAVRVAVHDGEEGPEITLQDDRAAAGSGGIGEIRTDLALSLSRLALGDAGGRVTVTEDGPGDRHLVVELRGAGSDPESDRQATDSVGDRR